MGYSPPWTDWEIEKLRRHWPGYWAGRLTGREASRLVGRTFEACRQRAAECGLRKPSFRTLGPRVAELVRRRKTVREICLTLGVSKSLVYRAFRLLGLRSYCQPGTPQWLRQSSRGVLVASRNQGTNPGRLAADARLRRFNALGYPFGVRNANQARAVDVARSQGGVSVCDLPRTPGGFRHASRQMLEYLVAAGVMVREDFGACLVRRSRNPVHVYRLSSEHPGVDREGRVGHYSCREE